MLPNSNEQKTIKQVVLIGVVFLMGGLGALILFGELTPLLILGIVFTLSPFIASSSLTAGKPSRAGHIELK